MTHTYQSSFVPPDLDCGDFEQLQPLYQALLDRPLENVDALRQWLADFSQLTAHVDEYGSLRRIEQSCHTDDPEIEKAFLHFVENIAPKIKPLNMALQRKCLDCGCLDQLESERFEVMIREWRTDVDLYRDENVPIQTEVTRTVTQYDKLCGDMLVDFRGKTYTMQQLARFIEEPDRETRQQAWEKAAGRRLQDREKIDALFDELMAKRRQIAANAGLDNYRDYVWRSTYRFDYTPGDCAAFADAVAETCVPLGNQLNERRRRAMGLDRLRPWDLSVDPKGRPPLRPFDPDHVEQLVEKTKLVFDRVDPRLGEQFAELRFGRNLDLDSRRGKRPGGYQSDLEVQRQPFIFMNAAGLRRDVRTMIHEGGHAFHYMAARQEPIVFVRHAPLEFCEVASMSMELLALQHLDVFFPDQQDLVRAQRQQLESITDILPWIATIDSFQHWLYTHPGHDHRQRTEAWLDIYRRFHGPAVDFSGYEDVLESRWQPQLHLFHYPFYYIEYGIAQLGALQVWKRYQQEPEAALRDLLEAFALGGKAPLPKLFETAGIRFDFSSATVGPLMEQLQDSLDALPED